MPVSDNLISILNDFTGMVRQNYLDRHQIELLVNCIGNYFTGDPAKNILKKIIRENPEIYFTIDFSECKDLQVDLAVMATLGNRDLLEKIAEELKSEKYFYELVLADASFAGDVLKIRSLHN